MTASVTSTRNRLGAACLCFAAAILVLSASSAGAETIVLRSGNAAIGNPDPFITMWAGPGGAPLSALPFTPADFSAACSGPQATVIQPISVWAQHLECDLEAKWIGLDSLLTPGSALYCQEFQVETCCIERALLTFCFAADDALGDPPAWGGPNLDGVYLNGVAVVPSISGGNYASQTVMTADVTGLVECGVNYLQVYNRDAGFGVSGVIYSAEIVIEECPTPVEESSWGSIKSLYR